jgi:hypothetical protein
VAATQLLDQGDREQLGHVGPGQVVDVVVLGDDVAVARLVGPVDGAVELEDHRPLVGGQVEVGVGLVDGGGRAVVAVVGELAPLRARGVVGDQVERLVDVAEGALQDIVVVGGHDQWVAGGGPSTTAQDRGQLGQELVQRRRRVVAVEQPPQLVVQRIGAHGQGHVLGHPGQVVLVAALVVEHAGQVVGELLAAGQPVELARVPGQLLGAAAQVGPGPQEHDHPAGPDLADNHLQMAARFGLA